MGCCDKQMRTDDEFEVIEILENATIIYEDGKREIFEAIYLTEYGEIIFGQILHGGIEDCPGFFREYGGIPKDNIKFIEGGIKKNVVKNSFRI